MSTDTTWTHERARVAALRRFRAADDPDVLDAERDLRAARLRVHVAAAVSAFPPLTAEQVGALTVLLHLPGTAASA